MSDSFPTYDGESDRLVSILIDPDASPIEKARASEQLYRRHSEWVIDKIRCKIYSPQDVQDVAQVVWMLVLDIKVLAREYVEPAGKFRAYLGNPVRWAIWKHIDKIPYILDEHGQKRIAAFTAVDDDETGDTLTGHRIYQMIENIIKPNLKQLSLKTRNVYMLNEHDTLFDSPPSVDEIATINDIADSEATTLLNSASMKSPAECDDAEFSVHVPVNYDSIIDRAQLERNSTVYLSSVMGVTSAAYRKRLHSGRKQLIRTVRENMLPEDTDAMNNG